MEICKVYLPLFIRKKNISGNFGAKHFGRTLLWGNHETVNPFPNTSLPKKHVILDTVHVINRSPLKSLGRNCVVLVEAVTEYLSARAPMIAFKTPCSTNHRV